jgi:hypothetical protein
MIRPTFFILCLGFIFSLNAQNLTQTIRGTIKDQDSGMPLLGATVVVINSDPFLGAVSDIDGRFRLENVPVGRVNLQVNFMGYEERILPNLLIGVAKEAIVEIEMTESLNNLEAVVVTARDSKSEVLNEMALVSARSFSVDETARYAGSFNDPARMVASFAGVTGNAEGNNDIVVRGNSPKGILWRLEGIEIPNPNHFAWEGSTVGPINALNSNMLNDSDFFSGAFAPEYGNALSGVFDMKLKKGNNEQREYTAGLSTLGLDFTLEGPFKEGYRGSYIANYRYSSLDLLDKAGIVDFGGVPKYQDLTFNVNLPISENQTISLFGLGGISSISNEWVDDDDQLLAQGEFGSDLGVGGLIHTYFINDRSFVRSNLSISGRSLSNEEYWKYDSIDAFYKVYGGDINHVNTRASSTYNIKLNARHKLETGFIGTRYNFRMNTRQWDFEDDRLETILEDNGYTHTLQSFASWKYRINEDLTMISGLHHMHFGLNNSSSLEPRLGLQWEHRPGSRFTAGFGIHSKLESASIYLAKDELEDGTVIQPNRSLEASKAAHFVVGYGRNIGTNTHFKMEAYYQHLYDVPIEDSDTSTFSLLNLSDGYINQPLVNDGTGRNFGIELTLERFLHNGFYYLTTLSLYESLYTAGSGTEQQTAFNGNYVWNVLAGKEFPIGKPEKNRVFFTNGKIALIGGNPYTPVLHDESIEMGYTVTDELRPFSRKGDDIFLMNISVGTRRNKGNTTREFKLDIQNVTNNQAKVSEYYIPPIEEVYESYQLPILPTIMYTFSF